MIEQRMPETTYASTLHGDVVGYSTLIADNEIETYHTLQVLRCIIEQELSRNDGDLASFVADEFLGVLPSEDAAISAAIEIQGKVGIENGRLPDGRKMQFRLGIHAGEVATDGDRWYGDAINIAARLD